MKMRVDPCNPHGHVLHIWTDRDGFKWACCAYDHGSMCRRCRQVTGNPTLEALIENVLLGRLWIFDSAEQDDLIFKITPEGTKYVEQMVDTIPEMRRLYDVGAGPDALATSPERSEPSPAPATPLEQHCEASGEPCVPADRFWDECERADRAEARLAAARKAASFYRSAALASEPVDEATDQKMLDALDHRESIPTATEGEGS